MSPYVDAVVFILVLLFFLISLAPLLENPPDVPGRKESKRTGDGREAG